jgi:hypothetical protein
MNLNSNVEALYEFIKHMIDSLKYEILQTTQEGFDIEMKDKKNITIIIEKMINMIVKLNKLSKDENLNPTEYLLENDLEIIENFLKKYKNK